MSSDLTNDSLRPSSEKVDSFPVNVTPREQEVMQLLARGFSSREIGGKMGISFHTVESYRKKLLQKFKARTTIEMMLRAGNVLPKEFWLQPGSSDEKASSTPR